MTCARAPDAAGRDRTFDGRSVRASGGHVTAQARADGEGPVRVRAFFREDGCDSRGRSPDRFMCIGGVTCDVERVLSEVGDASP